MIFGWTGEIIGALHNAKITHNEFAKKLNTNPKYVSAILNGKRSPKGAEQKFKAALDELIAEKVAINT